MGRKEEREGRGEERRGRVRIIAETSTGTRKAGRLASWKYLEFPHQRYAEIGLCESCVGRHYCCRPAPPSFLLQRSSKIRPTGLDR